MAAALERNRFALLQCAVGESRTGSVPCLGLSETDGGYPLLKLGKKGGCSLTAYESEGFYSGD